MLTLSTHLIAVEADKQIDFAGVLKESMGTWIERLCGSIVEETRRRLFIAFNELSYIKINFFLKKKTCFNLP